MQKLYVGAFLKVVFTSERYQASLFGGAECSSLVVTFDHWKRHKAEFRPISYTRVIEEAGLAELSIRTRYNDWYLSPETDDLLEAMHKASKPFRRVINYGFSMGGFGALLTSGATNADFIFLVSPQYSIDQAICPFEHRWMDEASQITRDVDPMSYANRNADGIVVYDPSIREDAAHAEMVTQCCPKIRPLAIRFSGHPATRITGETTNTRAVGNAIFSGEDHSVVRRIFKESRKASHSYWFEMATASTHRRPKLASIAYERALRLSEENAPLFAFVCAARSFDLGNHERLNDMIRIRNSHPDAPSWWDNRIAKAQKGLTR